MPKQTPPKEPRPPAIHSVRRSGCFASLVKYAVAAYGGEGAEETALDAVDGEGAVGGVGEEKAGVVLVEVLEAEDLFALGGVHDEAGEVGVANEGGEVTFCEGRLVYGVRRVGWGGGERLVWWAHSLVHLGHGFAAHAAAALPVGLGFGEEDGSSG